LSVHSKPGGGTHIEARIPLVHAPAERFPPENASRVERRKRMRA
jgi:hypothetical protein